MARTYVKMPFYDANVTSRGGISEANYDAQALDFRDAIRAQLDPDLLATNWLVSDLAKWDGVNGNVEGYGFTIFHRNGGSNTGPAWTWFIPGRNSNAGEAEFDDIVQPSQDVNYFYDTSGGVVFFQDGSPGMHYSQFGGTSDPYDFGYNLATGVLPGGDFSAPATSPYADLVTFMPSTPLRGWCYANMNANLVRNYLVLIADDTKPFLAVYHTSGLFLMPSYLTVQGNIIVPYRSTDVETHGLVSYTNSFTATAQGTVSAEVIQVQRDTGALDLMSSVFNTSFTEDNVPFDDGTFPWDVVALESSGYFKGWLDSDVIRVMGPNNRELNSLYDGGNLVKFTQYLCFPYAPNRTIWPSSPGS